MNRNKKEPENETIWEKYQRLYDEKGLATNFEALMKFPCKHEHELADGRKISAVLSVTPKIAVQWDEETQIGTVFMVHEEICTLCGKVCEFVPRRLFGLSVKS
jgi:hypothetical protein